MSHSQPQRKKVKHYHQPGDFHEFTFSCYRRMKPLANDAWREYPAGSIDGKHSPNPFVVPRFIGAMQRNPAKNRMNAVTTNCL